MSTRSREKKKRERARVQRTREREKARRQRARKGKLPLAYGGRPPVEVFPQAAGVTTSVPSDHFHSMTIGGIRVYRPRPDSEYFVKTEIQRFCKDNGLEGTYTAVDDIRSVFDRVLAFLANQFTLFVGKLGSRYLTEFLVLIDEAWATILRKFNQQELALPERVQCMKWGPSARRAIQYILERTVQLQPSEAPSVPKMDAVWWLDKLMICAEDMLSITNMRASAVRLFPNNYILSITGPPHEDWMTGRIKGELGERYEHFYQEVEHVGLRAFTAFGHCQMLQIVRRELEEPFKQEHGIGLEDSIAVLREIVEGVQNPDGSDSMPFVRRSHVLQRAASHFCHLDASSIEKILAPWTLTKADLDKEEPVLWKTKRRYRLIRRPLMLLPHSTGDHLCFAKHFVKSAVEFVFNDMAFGILPVEWQTPEVRRALKSATQRLDRDWERRVHEEWTKRGLCGCCSVDTLRPTDDSRVIVPPEVGEIDLVHFDRHQHALVVGEVKRIRPAFWGSEFADDMDKFHRKGGGYVSRFLRKIAWVRKNWKVVCEHLARWGGATVPTWTEPPRVAHVIVTDYQSIAEFFTDQTRVVSLAKLLKEFDETGTWGFSYANVSG